MAGKRSKDFTVLAKKARKKGWRVEVTKGGHLQWVPPNPDLPIVISALTPSDHRAYANTVARLRRSGLEV